MAETKRRGRLNIDERIAVAEAKVVSAKAKYDEALAHVEALKREKELASVNKDIQEKLKSSKRTPEEIMAFLDGE
jgi:hypothetical protein